jgi:hypothetical protein
VRRRDDEHQRLGVEPRQGDGLAGRTHAHERRSDPPEMDEAEIHLATPQELQNLPGMHLAEDDADPGMALHE